MFRLHKPPAGNWVQIKGAQRPGTDWLADWGAQTTAKRGAGKPPIIDFQFQSCSIIRSAEQSVVWWWWRRWRANKLADDHCLSPTQTHTGPNCVLASLLVLGQTWFSRQCCCCCWCRLRAYRLSPAQSGWMAVVVHGCSRNYHTHTHANHDRTPPAPTTTVTWTSIFCLRQQQQQQQIDRPLGLAL